MTTSESLKALRRANPRAKAGFAQSVEAADHAVRAQITPADIAVTTDRRSGPRHRLVGLSAAGASLAVAAVAAAFLAVGSSGDGPGVENAAAAVKRAATVTAVSAERSGTAVVRIRHNGQIWGGTTVRWHEGDVAVSRDRPRRPGKSGAELLVVDGTMYGVDPVDGGWVVLGDPANIDPGSGTTPDDYLTATRDDVGGVTLQRITGGMTGLTTSQLDDGSRIYSGIVAAGLVARETGFKEGQSIRVLPFGYVAHDEAADPAAPLDAAVTVGADGIVRKIAMKWGAGSSRWTYTVTYGRLGTTAALVAPRNPRPLRGRTPQEPGE